MLASDLFQQLYVRWITEVTVNDLGGTVIGLSYAWENRKRGRSSNE